VTAPQYLGGAGERGRLIIVDEEVVLWAYRLILGREPEAPETAAQIARDALSVSQLRRAFFESPEFQAKNGYGLRETGRFESHSATGPRITIISNCQGPEIARHLASMTGAAVIGRDVTAFRPELLDGWMRDCETADHIVAAPLSGLFEGLRVAQLKERFPGKVVTLSPVHFLGLFPDILALGPMSARLQGPMAEHSGLALYGFLSGLSVAECVALFRDETYERFGYYASWASSQAEFYEREKTADIRIADEFFGRVTHEPLLLTHNHPTTITFAMICRKLCSLLGIQCQTIPAGLGSTVQASMPTWPLYDEVARHHAIRYRSTQLFVREQEAYDLPTFVRRSYEVYARAGSEAMLVSLERCNASWRRAHPWIASVLEGRPPSAESEPSH